MSEAVQIPNLHQLVVDATDLARVESINSPLVAKSFYNLAKEAMGSLGEPGVLLIDFSRMGYLDSSALVVAVGDLVGLSFPPIQWNKTIACTNLKKTHLSSLDNALVVWSSLERHQKHRALLLACESNEMKQCAILGGLFENEKKIWELISGVDTITIVDLCTQLGINQEIVLSCLKVLFENRLVIGVRTAASMTLIALTNLIHI